MIDSVTIYKVTKEFVYPFGVHFTQSFRVETIEEARWLDQLVIQHPELPAELRCRDEDDEKENEESVYWEIDVEIDRYTNDNGDQELRLSVLYQPRLLGGIWVREMYDAIEYNGNWWYVFSLNREPFYVLYKFPINNMTAELPK